MGIQMDQNPAFWSCSGQGEPPDESQGFRVLKGEGFFLMSSLGFQAHRQGMSGLEPPGFESSDPPPPVDDMKPREVRERPGEQIETLPKLYQTLASGV
jgi:hypothetical protein